MLTAFRLPVLSLAAASLLTLGCHAQMPALQQGKPLPVATQFKIESLLRRKAELPPMSEVNIGPLQPSKMNGFGSVMVTVSTEGNVSHPIEFLLSDDGKTLEQVTSFDIGADPKALVSAEDRPARGGPASAPVTIVGFDDLECPYCAKLHATIFPAIQNRYGDKVRVVYRDFPLDMHPWAEHAAVDVECLAAQSAPAYWAAVDAIHAQHDGIGGDPKNPKADKTMALAVPQLDAIARTQGVQNKLDMVQLNACLAKQDTKAVEASKQLAMSLNLQSAPTLFINGDKVDGAVPIEFIFSTIDRTLRAYGVTPPPPYVAPVVAPTPTPAAASGAKGK